MAQHEEDKVSFSYEGDKNDHKTLVCVFTYRGKEYRFPYEYYSSLALLYGVPDPVRDYMLFGAKMKHNPD